MDANRGFKVTAEKAKMLDQIFGKWGIVWRKDRWYPDSELLEVIAAGHAAKKDEAARWLELNGRPGYLRSTGRYGAGDYTGRKTIIQLAYEEFGKIAKSSTKDPYIQNNWPGYPDKHAHMEHIDVWEKGLAPPRIRRGGVVHELVSRAPNPTKQA